MKDPNGVRSSKGEDLRTLSVLTAMKNTYPEIRSTLRRRPSDLAIPAAIAVTVLCGIVIPQAAAWAVVGALVLSVLHTLHLVGRSVAKGDLRTLAEELAALPGREGEAAIARNRHDLAALREHLRSRG